MNDGAGHSDKEIIAENAAYVLGMYDMYQNDQEITDMLRMKGLNEHLVKEIMIRVKKPAWEKRVRQAKILMLIGAALLICFAIIPYLYIHFSGSGDDPSQQADRLLDSDGLVIRTHKAGEGFLVGFFKLMIRFMLYVIILGVVQLVGGIYKYIKYKRLLLTSSIHD